MERDQECDEYRDSHGGSLERYEFTTFTEESGQERKCNKGDHFNGVIAIHCIKPPSKPLF